VNTGVAKTTYKQLFMCFLALGCTSFGGPVAHIGFFREAFVASRKWLSEERFSDYLSLCQFIPGPASSQLGMAIGYHQKGYLGALIAWLGFTLPSALILFGFAVFVASDSAFINEGAIGGLKLVALAVVAHAFWSMAKVLAPDAMRSSIMIVSAALMRLWPESYTAPLLIAAVGLLSAVFRPVEHVAESLDSHIKSSRSGLIPFLCLAVFALLLMVPWLGSHHDSVVVSQFFAYFQSGALVFGGGHVVLPLLESEVLSAGWVERDSFLVGYVAAQAVPGPLFTFASYLGASHIVGLTLASGAALATVAIFLPSFLLVFGILPFWDKLRLKPRLRSALWGINASVVGLLLAALYDPVWVSSVHDAKDLSFAMCVYLALVFWRIPPPILVVLGGVFGVVVL
jgi:chromate transporter